MRDSLARRMAEDGYDGYAYSYPHKTAYRPLDPPVPLQTAWRDEPKNRLFLYLHLPFCEMRCGFCNLFTTVRPGQDVVSRTLAAIERQSETVAACVAPERVAQAAIGGGTPSFLSERQLEQLLGTLGRHWKVSWPEIPLSFEVSPGTISRSKLALLKDLGVDRLSMGVQSFLAEDLAELKRPQPLDELERACQMLRAADFPILNLDLIYGIPGQSSASWEQCLKKALAWSPDELYLYPLYVGPLTRLDLLGRRPGEFRRTLYRQARDLLLAAGYRQISMRYFCRSSGQSSEYSCQQDGMVGLGPGARSYTRDLHYSSAYAVGQTGVRSILADFCGRDRVQMGQADYGVRLDSAEQRVRFLLKSLLRAEGISLIDYAGRFGRSLFHDFPQLAELSELGLAETSEGVLRLTAEGLAWTDTIGPWLYSDATRARMEDYAPA